ncbi:MAG: C_GCAxxG_C_C family protein [Dehalococcoidales bacterium]|nr:C_GCAxxG_C_C family protein [Dehalococcoidales bacterium]
MNRADSAAENIAAGRMNCAQSVLTAFSGELGMDKEQALKIALGFGGGMGRTGKTCGAVTGAYMVIGLKQEKQNVENAREVKDRVYALVRDFNHRFMAVRGSTDCKDLLGCDLSTPEGQAASKEKGFSFTLCPGFVRDAVKILEEMDTKP